MRLIWALDHGLQSLSKRMQASIGLTGPQRVALRVLGRRPGISAGALSDILRLHPSTLTGILHRLERRGLVRRTRDPEDRRRARLALTARGRQLNVSTPGTVEAVVKRVLAGIPETRLRPAAELPRGRCRRAPRGAIVRTRPPRVRPETARPRHPGVTRGKAGTVRSTSVEFVPMLLVSSTLPCVPPTASEALGVRCRVLPPLRRRSRDGIPGRRFLRTVGGRGSCSGGGERPSRSPDLTGPAQASVSRPPEGVTYTREPGSSHRRRPAERRGMCLAASTEGWKR